MLDLSKDMSTGQAAIDFFTLRDKQFVSNVVNGVGGKEGAVASPVAGSKLVNSGYAGIAIYNPYRSYVMIEV